MFRRLLAATLCAVLVAPAYPNESTLPRSSSTLSHAYDAGSLSKTRVWGSNEKILLHIRAVRHLSGEQHWGCENCSQKIVVGSGVTYDYDAFGVLIHQTGTTPNTTLYSGEQFDSDLGLYFNRARYLNTSAGRFWNMDSFEGDDNDPLSLHKYLYASSDPVNRIDPLGHEDADVSSNLVSAAGQAILATIALVSAIAAVCTVDYQLGRDDCIDHGKNRIDLYHYTALPNVQKIRDSGQLWPSLLSAGDAYFGEGQYFTDISPTDASTRTKGQLAFAVYSDPRKWWNSEVGYLRFNLSQASVKRVRSVYGPSFPGKGIYLHPSLLGLTLSGNLSGSGIVTFLAGQ